MIIPWVCFVLLFANMFVCFFFVFFLCIVGTGAFYPELDIIKFNLKRKKKRLQQQMMIYGIKWDLHIYLHHQHQKQQEKDV